MSPFGWFDFPIVCILGCKEVVMVGEGPAQREKVLGPNVSIPVRDALMGNRAL